MEIAIIASLLSVLLGFFIGNISRKKYKIEIDSVQSKIHTLEKQVHIKERDHLEELNNIRKSHFNEINQVRETSYKEGSQKTKSEIEMQQKSISVSIRPYIKTIIDKVIINDSYITEAGYQYQLLINGIPALSPQIVIERREELSNFNQDNFRLLAEIALKLTQQAVDVYLSGVGPGLVFKKDALVQGVSPQT